MAVEEVRVEAEPERALAALRASSRARPVLVFKRSPFCPVSGHAEEELAAWRSAAHGSDLGLAVIDVIASRALARGLTAALGVRHESPQALWLAGGELVTHASHGALTAEWFERGRREAADRLASGSAGA